MLASVFCFYEKQKQKFFVILELNSQQIWKPRGLLLPQLPQSTI